MKAIARRLDVFAKLLGRSLTLVRKVSNVTVWWTSRISVTVLTPGLLPHTWPPPEENGACGWSLHVEVGQMSFLPTTTTNGVSKWAGRLTMPDSR